MITMITQIQGLQRIKKNVGWFSPNVCVLDEMIILANVLENTFQVHICAFTIQNTNTKSEYQYVLPHAITFMNQPQQ
jgi:hypothetical protein